jgi:hypothetical protein
MPEAKITGGTTSQAESVGQTLTGASGAASADVAKVASNLTLASHLGNFVAGQVASQFANENLVDTVKGKNAITVSVGWG